MTIKELKEQELLDLVGPVAGVIMLSATKRKNISITKAIDLVRKGFLDWHLPYVKFAKIEKPKDLITTNKVYSDPAYMSLHFQNGDNVEMIEKPRKILLKKYSRKILRDWDKKHQIYQEGSKYFVTIKKYT